MIRRFNRFELKYRITARERDAILPVILAHMRPDREGDPSGVYRVTSLYYDTVDLSCYRAKLDGVNFRRKLRIRRYGELDTDPNAEVMVEIKQRINRTTQKRRVLLPVSEAYALCEGGIDRDFDDPLDRAVGEEVRFLAGAQQLGPKCVISYTRRAFVGSAYEPGLRITFDRDLRVADASSGLAPNPYQLTFLPADHAILEVKTNEVIPVWVTRLLAAHSIGVVRFSKYCAGLARLRNAPRAHDLGRGASDG